MALFGFQLCREALVFRHKIGHPLLQFRRLLAQLIIAELGQRGIGLLDLFHIWHDFTHIPVCLIPQELS